MFNAILFLIGNLTGGISMFNYEKYLEKSQIEANKRLVEQVLQKQKNIGIKIEKINERSLEAASKLDLLKQLSHSLQQTLVYTRTITTDNTMFLFIGGALVSCLVLTALFSETSGIHTLNANFNTFAEQMPGLAERHHKAVLDQMHLHQTAILEDTEKILKEQINNLHSLKTDLNLLNLKIEGISIEQENPGLRTFPHVEIPERGRSGNYSSILDTQI